jgi:molecular chaperone DnaJ
VRRSSGFFSLASTCPTCSGTGTVLEHPCTACSGRGTVTKRQKIKVTIPAGIETGKRINIPGQGDAGQNGGPAGDLYVFIQVKPHRFFERDGVDLYCALPVSITQASLGAEVHVPTLDGRKVKLRIPGGTQNGKMLRLRGEGVPVLNNSSRRGDLYIRVHVRVPERLSIRAKSILREFAQVQGEDESPEPIPLAELR